MALIISLLSALLSIILVVFNWRINKNAIFLSLFFLIFSTYGMSHYFTVYGADPFWCAVFYAHPSPFWLLLGPFLYFYVRGTLTDKQGICWKDSWHFIPAILHLVNLFPYLTQSFDKKLEIAVLVLQNLDGLKSAGAGWIYPPPVSFIERSGLLFFYSAYIIYQLAVNYVPSKQNFNQIPQKQYLLIYRWLLILNGIVLMISMNYFLLTLSLLNVKASIGILSLNPVYYMAGIAFVLLPLSLLLFPQVLYGIPIYSFETEVKSAPISKQKAEVVNPPNNIIEPEDPFQELAQRIMAYLKKQKPYLNPDFSITDLSIALKVPQHHISYCFNSILKIKFTLIKTQLRVEHAQKLLKKGSAQDLSMDGIGKESGFASRSTFYDAFKSQTGLTPTEFLQQRS